MQLKHIWQRYPNVIKAMYANDPIIAPLLYRLRFYVNKLYEFKASPKRIIRFISGAILREVSMGIGKIKYMIHPNEHIWNQAQSTK